MFWPATYYLEKKNWPEAKRSCRPLLSRYTYIPLRPYLAITRYKVYTELIWHWPFSVGTAVKINEGSCVITVA